MSASESVSLKITVLGCGTSTGVPVIACDCAVCTSAHPRNRRTRPSVLLETGEQTILIDAGPDLREQCLREQVRRVDAVLFTHAHADHILGLDDLRIFNFRQQKAIPCFGSARTLAGLRQTFSYVFDGKEAEGGGKPQLELIEVSGGFKVHGLEVAAIPVAHGSLEVTAFRIGAFAYVTDCHAISEESLTRLKGVETLILDALRYRAHPTHLSVDEAIAIAARIGAGKTYLTHLAHDIDYGAPQVNLPPGVEFAYDGLSFFV